MTAFAPISEQSDIAIFLSCEMLARLMPQRSCGWRRGVEGLVLFMMQLGREEGNE